MCSFCWLTSKELILIPKLQLIVFAFLRYELFEKFIPEKEEVIIINIIAITNLGVQSVIKNCNKNVTTPPPPPPPAQLILVPKCFPFCMLSNDIMNVAIGTFS